MHVASRLRFSSPSRRLRFSSRSRLRLSILSRLVARLWLRRRLPLARRHLHAAFGDSLQAADDNPIGSGKPFFDHAHLARILWAGLDGGVDRFVVGIDDVDELPSLVDRKRRLGNDDRIVRRPTGSRTRMNSPGVSR